MAEKVEIPSNLYKKIEEKIKGSEFKSVSDYVTFVLRELIAAEAEQGAQELSGEEEAKVKDRLRSLGYMD
jgi:Arc/MetJ-type ribon-helix-helix transcriptional regulator